MLLLRRAAAEVGGQVYRKVQAATSIVMSGCYEDDHDAATDIVKYTGGAGAWAVALFAAAPFHMHAARLLVGGACLAQHRFLLAAGICSCCS
jgi:hypothetical protein